MLRMELHGSRSKGRPERRFMDVAKEGVEVAGVREEDAEDRGDGGGRSTEPLREQLEEEHLSIGLNN